MNYEVTIYFAGPTTTWSGTVQPEDIITRRSMPWRWLALAWARSAERYLDPSKCGITVRRDWEIIHDRPPSLS